MPVHFYCVQNPCLPACRKTPLNLENGNTLLVLGVSFCAFYGPAVLFFVCVCVFFPSLLLSCLRERLLHKQALVIPTFWFPLLYQPLFILHFSLSLPFSIIYWLFTICLHTLCVYFLLPQCASKGHPEALCMVQKYTWNSDIQLLRKRTLYITVIWEWSL